MKEVVEAVDTGLAIQYLTETEFRKPVNPFAPATAYNLVHVHSGTSLTNETAPGIVCAAMWLRRILPSCDWALPVEVLQRRHDEVAYLVHSALIEVMQEYNGLRRRSGETRGALWYSA